MVTEKKAKTSAYYQRQYRQRLRDQGFVKKEIWVLPSRAGELQDIEKSMREPISLINVAAITERKKEMTKIAPKLWTTTELAAALADTDLVKDNRAEIELINGDDPCLLITMYEFGDLPVFLTVMRNYILAEALLWPVSEVKDADAFNRECMRASKLFPLSYICIDMLEAEHYIMYGALSATSLLSNVLFEIETLADNVIKATEAFEPYLKFGA